MKKRILSLLMTLVLLVVGAAPLVHAEDDDIVLYGDNYTSCSIGFSISSTGKASMSASATGYSQYIKKMTVTLVIHVKNGSSWQVLKTTPPQWCAASTTTSLNASFSTQLSSKGTYRLVGYFSFEGTYPNHPYEYKNMTQEAVYK